MCYEHKYNIKGTTVRVLKTLGSVQWLKTFSGTTVSFFKTLGLKYSLTLNMFVELADSRVAYRVGPLNTYLMGLTQLNEPPVQRVTIHVLTPWTEFFFRRCFFS